ncbi:unnamed protein product [Oppiella nova]|uniref:Transmembrane protein n=1 Tax=Oppiella nova TaxID=334625 RepID=A0A7R9M441_9ACAR|nr:unnamed protein product [Oppiella nova]CAG2170403.1 unnamed protein product [Oppiella nova]
MNESNPVTTRMDNSEALPLKGTDTVDGYHRQEGSVYVHDCPKDPAIPGTDTVDGYNRQGSKTFELKDCLNFCGGLACFGALAGVGVMILVFSARFPDFTDADSLDYCHPTLYLTAYWIILIGLIICAFFLVLGCGMVCFTMIAKNRN